MVQRRLLLLAFLPVLAGCGSSRDAAGPEQPVAISVPGRIDARARTYRPTAGCTAIPIQGTSGPTTAAPPIPQLSAHIDGWKLTISWRFLARPSACRPVAVLVTANSVDKPDNMAFGRGGGGAIPINGTSGSVTLYAPFMDLPPYEARLSGLDKQGIRGPVSTVPVSGSRPGCTATRPVATCITEARALFERCLTGSAPRVRCHPKAWRVHPPLPINPLHGVTTRSLEASVRTTLEPMNNSQVTLAGVSCTRMPYCRVTWRAPGRPGPRVRVRYRMSGMKVRGSHGCWIGARQVVARGEDRAVVTVLEGWGNAFTQPSGCTSWPKH
jgi:hypothetical protein